MVSRIAPSSKAADKNNGSVFSVSEKPRSVFIAARRHSKRVHLLKIILPLIAIIIAGVFSWFTFFATSAQQDVIILNTEMSEDGRMVMTQPKVEGYTKANQPYLMQAGRAIQGSSQNGIIELQNITAKIPMARRGWADVAAIRGFYDNINGRLQLDKPFTVTTSDGTTARLQSANINLETSQIKTTEPIDIKRSGQHLTADTMQVKDDGSIMVFHGNVRLVIDNQTAQ